MFFNYTVININGYQHTDSLDADGYLHVELGPKVERAVIESHGVGAPSIRVSGGVNVMELRIICNAKVDIPEHLQHFLKPVKTYKVLVDHERLIADVRAATV